MVQIQQSVKRSRGRPQVPCDEDTRQLIGEAAAKEFQAKGYAATCIGDVAQRAGVSTRTLYRLIPTKAVLFRAVVTDRIEGFMLAIDEQVLGALDLEAALERILSEFGRLTLSEETIAINRLVIGECERFPEIAAPSTRPPFRSATRWRTGSAGKASRASSSSMIHKPQQASCAG
jgi:AcrR family transcriptional regulator